MLNEQQTTSKRIGCIFKGGSTDRQYHRFFDAAAKFLPFKSI